MLNLFVNSLFVIQEQHIRPVKKVPLVVRHILDLLLELRRLLVVALPEFE
jgi:hypothetical protein